jgi:O-antigen/teichoic acid export membrane protein
LAVEHFAGRRATNNLSGLFAATEPLTAYFYTVGTKYGHLLNIGMSQIRKKSLKASAWIYLGFLVGAANTWLFTKLGWFAPGQYGLTRVMIEIGQLFYAFSTLGAVSFLYKFFPYYEDNVEPRQNDILGLSFMVSLGGFLLTAGAALLFEPLIVKKFGTNSPLLVDYFYWILPLAFFILQYNLLEAYAYGFKKGVFTSLLKETVLRLFVFVLIVLKVMGLISFDTFLALFAFQYAFIMVVLAVYLHRQGQLWVSFRFSRVTKKFRKKIWAIMAFTFIVIIVGVLRQSIDSLVLAAKQNLGSVGIFGFAAYMVSILQAPFRSIVAVTIPLLSRAWKEKDLKEISRIYKRSSINLLSFALLVFFCVWLNYTQAIGFFGIDPDYLEGRWVFFMLGIVTIVEMGTGINGQIIGTSSFWRFELWTSLLLTLLIIPLSYFLTNEYAILGPAIANIISFVVYNTVRIVFLWKKYGMQPFSIKTLEIIIIAVAGYFAVHALLGNMEGLWGMALRTGLYMGLFLAGLYFRNISPDFVPVVHTVLRRLKLKR